MAECTIVDTSPDFEAVWVAVRDRPVDEQARAWREQYLARYPELAESYLREFGADGLDWRQVATQRALPLIAELMPAMREAHANILDAAEPTWSLANEALGLALPVTFVLYVGLGWCGWATRYGGSPACLLDLAGIAEEGWTAPGTLSGLIAHEIGHLAHQRWRELADVAPGGGAAWQLYAEGLAQVCEHRILSRPSWHMQASDPSWLSWCEQHLSWLAARYLAALDTGAAVNQFFGSWLEIDGQSMTGYYLGHELVARWFADEDLATMAALTPSEVETRVRAGLAALARGLC